MAETGGLICLVIMIKDGKSVIGPTLEAAMPHMDAWFIFDTGSTDGTQDYIRKLMTDKFPDKPGTIVEEAFVNFEVSRSRALEVARETFPNMTFQMMLDDSYIVHNGEVLRHFLTSKQNQMDKDDGYMITIGTPTSALQYNSARIFRTAAKVAYEGVVHEVPNCSADEIVPRQCYIEDGKSDETAERSRKRFHRDLALLLPEVKAQRGNYSRNVFYLAQTYECLDRHEKAVEWYRKRTELVGFLGKKRFLSTLFLKKCIRGSLHFIFPVGPHLAQTVGSRLADCAKLLSTRTRHQPAPLGMSLQDCKILLQTPG